MVKLKVVALIMVIACWMLFLSGCYYDPEGKPDMDKTVEHLPEHIDEFAESLTKDAGERIDSIADSFKNCIESIASFVEDYCNNNETSGGHDD